MIINMALVITTAFFLTKLSPNMHKTVITTSIIREPTTTGKPKYCFTSKPPVAIAAADAAIVVIMTLISIAGDNTFPIVGP